MQHFLKYPFCNIQFTKQYFHKRDTNSHFFVSKKYGAHIRRATKTQASIFGLCPAPNNQEIGGLCSEQAARPAPLRQKSCKPDKHPTIRHSSDHRPTSDRPSSVVRQTALRHSTNHRPTFEGPSSDIRQTALRHTTDRPPRSNSFLLCSSDYSLTPPLPSQPTMARQRPNKKSIPTIAAESLQT